MATTSPIPHRGPSSSPTDLEALAPLLLRTIGTPPAPTVAAGTRTKVLLVEDNSADARLIEIALPRTEFEVVHVTSLAAATRRLELGRVDVVLLDLSLPDGEGAETIAWTLAAAPGTPVVVLTGLANDDVAVQAVRVGVQDYLVKDQVDSELLPRTIRYAIERERLTAELDALRRHQLETKNQLLSHVSHELRTPLNAVYQFVMLLIDEIGGPLTTDQREYLEITRRNVTQLRAMIGDLLDATRLEAGTLAVEPVATDLGMIAAETMQALAAEAQVQGVRLVTDLEPRLTHVRADALRLRQVLTNLLHNAIKFTPSGGEVVVAAARDPEAPDFIRTRVTDTGPGIAAEALPQIFKRFQQGAAGGASRKGLGLGLYICRELVQRQGGRIWVESVLGQGTTFTFTLPAWTAPPEETPIV